MPTQVKVADVVGKARQLLNSCNVSNDEISTVIAHLLECDRAGKTSHGFYRLPGIIRTLKGNTDVTTITYEEETPATALVNGGKHLGLVVAEAATLLAIQKAKSSRISTVGAYNYVGTTGTMGYYARKIAESELVGIIMCNSEYAVAPWGGKDAILGTNPIAISIPTGRDPIVLDLATSAWSYGDLALAMREGRQVPTGIVVDKDGNPSTDPNDADNGAMLPMAAHKGYALGLAVEILAGPFVRAKAGKDAVLGSDGFLVIALEAGLFSALSDFKLQVDALVDEIKQSSTVPGGSPIQIPGERSLSRLRENAESEVISLPESILDEIEQLLRDI